MGRSGDRRAPNKRPGSGPAANLLSYVECDPKGVGARPDLCERVGVRRYPTWMIAGERYEGVLMLDRLAELSNFPGQKR